VKAKIIGIRDLDFVPQARRRGEAVEAIVGLKMFLTFEEEGVSGLSCASVFLKDEEITEAFRVGDEVNAYYGKSGKLKEVFGVVPRPLTGKPPEPAPDKSDKPAPDKAHK
jgi:hypothetical protein